MFKLFTLIVAAIAVSLVTVTYLVRVPDPPDIDIDRWWGNGEKGEKDESTRPFKIEFNNTVFAL